jgi:hypothetical protein
VDHLLANKNVAAVLVFGHRDTLVETPPALKGANPAPDGIETEDRPLFEAVGESYRKLTSFSRAVKDPADGAFHQWAYFQYGIPAFAAKVFEPPALPQATSLPTGKKAESDEAKRLLDSDARLGGKGFAPWRPFKHPTLGDVEIGGFVPLADSNPPKDRIPELTRIHAKFVFELLAMLPRASIEEVATRPLGAGGDQVPRSGTSRVDRRRAQRRPLSNGAPDRNEDAFGAPLEGHRGSASRELRARGAPDHDRAPRRRRRGTEAAVDRARAGGEGRVREPVDGEGG